jgi:hypothetical protein
MAEWTCKSDSPRFVRLAVNTRLSSPNSIVSGSISRKSTSEPLAGIAGVVFAVMWSARR